MDKTAEPKSNSAPVANPAAASDAPVKPVRSAKDAINAMYAEENKSTLSSYLATSAKEIINSTASTSDNKKSASSLHRGSAKQQVNRQPEKRKIETSRPSASGVMRVAKSEPKNVPSDTTHAMDPLAQKTAPVVTPRLEAAPEAPAAAPVIKTSLKLGPKKTPVVMRSQAAVSRAAMQNKTLHATKGQTALARLLANRRASRTSPSDISATSSAAKPHAAMTDVIGASPRSSHAAGTPDVTDAKTAETLRIMQQAVKKTTGQDLKEAPKTIPRPKMRPPRGLMQDVIRPGSAPVSAHGAAASASATNITINSKPKAKHSAGGLPLDSVKRRFRPAPKGFTAAPETQNSAYVGGESTIDDYDISNSYAPSTFAADTSADKPPVEIYGLMDEEPTGKRPEMPVIEDYHSENGKSAASETPDNNKYAIKGQSPFFLKSVNVEKRPLSGSIASRSDSASTGTLYERPDSTPVSGKNVYDKKEVKKSLPTKPTVIIPASRRSRAPLIFLLILTVILGAAVGAFVYLCFFQYME